MWVQDGDSMTCNIKCTDAGRQWAKKVMFIKQAISFIVFKKSLWP